MVRPSEVLMIQVDQDEAGAFPIFHFHTVGVLSNHKR
jgi:hypothetical protein